MALFIIQFWIRRMRIRHQRETIADALFRGLDNFPFAQQNFAQRHFTWTRFVPDIIRVCRVNSLSSETEKLSPRARPNASCHN